MPSPATSGPAVRFAASLPPAAAARRKPAAGACAEARAALEELCQIYWPPVYAYLRRDGRKPQEAEDIMQGFFCQLLERGDLQRLAPEQGRFRSFLLAAMKNFMANQRRRQRALKRGGNRAIVSLDAAVMETHLQREPAQSWTLERAFDRQWALTLLDRVRRLLADEFAAAGKAEQFQRLSPFLASDPPSSRYAELARQWRTSQGAVKVAVHRLRRKFRDRLRDEIAQTVHSAEQIADEIQRLFAALGGR